MVFATNITSISANTTLSTKFDVYLVDASGGNITITLPNILGDGMQYRLQRTDTSANTVTVQGFSGGQTISGSTSILLYTYTSLMVQSYNTVWYAVANSLSHGSLSKVLFSTAFVANSSAPYISLSTNGGGNTPVLFGAFYYPGSNIETISRFTIVIYNNNNAPTAGTLAFPAFKFQTVAGLTLCNLDLSTVPAATATPFVLASSSITTANLPTGPSVIQMYTDYNGSSVQLRIQSLTVQ